MTGILRIQYSSTDSLTRSLSIDVMVFEAWHTMIQVTVYITLTK